MKIIIGLDVGTTGCKAVAVNQSLRILAVATAGYPLHSPSADRAEQDIAQVWRGCTQALRGLTGKLNGRPIAGLCLSGAMHSLMMVDQDHKPLDRAWTWADARCAGSVRILQNNPEAQKLYHRTGCPLQAMYHPARLHWLKHHDQSHFRSKPFYVGIKDALLHKLTGRWVTDWAIASATGLLNLQTHQWDEDALHQLGITSAQLPEPVSPFSVVGALLNGVARQTGLPEGLPVIAGGSDGMLANIGAGGVRGGEMVATVGTTGALRRITTAPLLDGKARTWCYVMDENRYLAGGAINNGGLTLQWIHDHFYKDQGGFDALFKEAKTIKPGCDGLMLLPYFTGERSPHWQPHARAAWVGLSLAHMRAHMARAGMEAVALCLRDLWELIVVADTGPKVLRLTGGITKSPLWCQIVADVLGVTIAPLEAADASAVGAAMIGHVALKHSPSLEAISQHLQVPRRRYHPDKQSHQRYRELHQRFAALGQRIIFNPSQSP